VGHQILDVVRAAQLRLIQSQHRFVFKNDRAFDQAKVGPIGVGAESDFARAEIAQALNRVYNRDIIGVVFRRA